MLIRKAPIILISLICIATIYLLFNVKEEVLNIKAQLAKIDQEIEKEQNNIKILKTEFTYLSSPERLKQLNKNHLKLQETQLAQIDTISDKQPAKSTMIASSKTRIRPKWNYKRNNEQYLTLVAVKK